MIRYFLTPALLFISVFSFSQSDVFKSIRTTSAVKIDGDAAEWQMPLRYYDSETKLFFDFSNNGNNLYLCFQSKDEAGQTKIMRAGMTVTLKIKGKGKASVKFPLQQEADGKTTMEVKGFKDRDGVIAANDVSGLNAAMNRADRILTYEVAIPLKELSGDDYIKDFEKDIELAVEVHPLKQNGSGGEKGFSGRGGGGGNRMGGGGGGGGMRHGGGGGNRNGNTEKNEQEGNSEINQDRAAMFEKTEFKQKFILSK